MRLTLARARELRPKLEGMLADACLHLGDGDGTPVTDVARPHDAARPATPATLAGRKHLIRRLSRTVRAFRVNIARASVAANIENHVADIDDLDLCISLETSTAEVAKLRRVRDRVERGRLRAESEHGFELDEEDHDLLLEVGLIHAACPGEAGPGARQALDGV